MRSKKSCCQIKNAAINPVILISMMAVIVMLVGCATLPYPPPETTAVHSLLPATSGNAQRPLVVNAIRNNQVRFVVNIYWLSDVSLWRRNAELKREQG